MSRRTRDPYIKTAFRYLNGDGLVTWFVGVTNACNIQSVKPRCVSTFQVTQGNFVFADWSVISRLEIRKTKLSNAMFTLRLLSFFDIKTIQSQITWRSIWILMLSLMANKLKSNLKNTVCVYYLGSSFQNKIRICRKPQSVGIYC